MYGRKRGPVWDQNDAIFVAAIGLCPGFQSAGGSTAPRWRSLGDPYASFQSASGEVVVSTLEPGSIAGTFTVDQLSMNAWNPDDPLPDGEHVVSATNGGFLCHGKTDGPYAGCF